MAFFPTDFVLDLEERLSRRQRRLVTLARRLLPTDPAAARRLLDRARRVHRRRVRLATGGAS